MTLFYCLWPGQMKNIRQLIYCDLEYFVCVHELYRFYVIYLELNIKVQFTKRHGTISKYRLFAFRENININTLS